MPERIGANAHTMGGAGAAVAASGPAVPWIRPHEVGDV